MAAKPENARAQSTAKIPETTASANATATTATTTTTTSPESQATPTAASGDNTTAAKNSAQAKTQAKTKAKADTVTHAGFDPQAWRQLLGPKYWGSWLALGLLAVCAYIPNRIRDGLSWLLSFGLQHLNIRFRRIVFANLHTAFPEKSDAECKTLYRKILLQALIAAFSYGESVFLPRFMLKRRWQVFNQEALDWALQSKKPIIFCVPHTFALDRCGLYLSFSGLPMFAVVNDQDNPVFNWFLNYQRITFGGTIHTREAGFRSILKALKQGRHCYFLCDEDLGPESAHFVNFFGVPKAMVGSLPRMAKVTDAVVLVLYCCYNLKTAMYELHFTAVDNFPQENAGSAGHNEQGLDEDLQRITDIFMQDIAAAPEQYMWFLRIFKTVPDKRYFVDIYENSHGRKVDHVIDYAHRREPLLEPLMVNEKNYQPPVDYAPIVAGLKAKQQAAADHSRAATVCKQGA